MNYGFHRVISPLGVVPQAAWKVNNDISNKLHPTEKIIDVKILNLDSTSMKQIREKYKDVARRVKNIVKIRGKMHNPVTNSGGVMLAQYDGETIVPWVSLSAISLSIEKIHGVHGQQIDIDGKAVLFESYKYTVIPKDMDWRLAVTALDIASLAVQIRRIAQRNKLEKVLVIGCGNAGITSMATIKKYSPGTNIYGIDVDDKNFSKIKKFFTNNLGKIDAVDSQTVYNFCHDCDLVVNCVNVSHTEASSVIATKDYGKTVFFSMATQFDRASLATDATGKDVEMIVASGIAIDEDKEIFSLLQQYPDLLTTSHK